MHKVFVAVRREDRDRLLDLLRELGVVHLVPVDPDRAGHDEKERSGIRDAERTVRVLSGITPAGKPPDVPVADIPRTVLGLQQKVAECRSELVNLKRQLGQMKIWGDVELEKFGQLREVGIDVRFYVLHDDQVESIEAECVHPVASMSGHRSLVAVIDRRGDLQLPETATNVPLPRQSAPLIRAEMERIDASVRQDLETLSRLAHLTGEMNAELPRLLQKRDHTSAVRGGLDADGLFAIQGWIPSERSESLEKSLAGNGVAVAVRLLEPLEDEQPPTQISYPVWTRPIRGLFGMLGTVAGYRESDVSAPFMIALPIFAAMLISDGGYGAVLFFVPLFGYRKIAPLVGSDFTRLLMVVGAAATIWGLLCASFFGFVLYTPPIPVNLSEQSRDMVMKISFVMGAVHLSLAQLWQAVALYPNLRFLNKVGWALFVWGMLGVVMVYVLGNEMTWGTAWPYLLIGGATLTVVFCEPGRGIPASIGLGLANFPMSMLSSFSDVISYVRLMAVGLASSVLAASFNKIALDIEFWPGTVLVLILGHGLNLGLALIALFAHGVRLNMLEFSNNLGMRWTGYAFAPFHTRISQENA